MLVMCGETNSSQQRWRKIFLTFIFENEPNVIANIMKELDLYSYLIFIIAKSNYIRDKIHLSYWKTKQLQLGSADFDIKACQKGETT